MHEFKDENNSAIFKVEEMKLEEDKFLESQKWTVDELKLFVQKFLVWRYDFEQIARFFGNKSVKNIVTLFYFVKK